MKLLLSVALLGVLSISADGLQCQSCTGACATETTVTCSTETMCITSSSILENTTDDSVVSSRFKGCASSTLCSSTGTTFSVDLGHFSRRTSAECCDTDSCNTQDLPFPTAHSSTNGLICFFCYDGFCTVSVDCQGEEDRCFQGTDTGGNRILGCASSNVCQPARVDGELPFFEEVGELQGPTTCCDTTDCNTIVAQEFQCLSCTDPTCSSVESITCSTESMCITASSILEDRQTTTTETSFFRGCASSSLCPSTGPTTFSVDLGISGRFVSAECCDTDNCNSQAFSSPTPPQTTNGLQCFFCGFGQCETFLDCLGDEDRCIQGNDIYGNPFRGCASANVCKPTRIDRGLPFFDDLDELTCGTTCCDTNRCNDGTTQGLQCLACTDPTCSNVESVTCSTESMCITASSVLEDRLTSTNETSFFRGCASSSLCPSTGPTTFTLDLGVSDRFISAECCDTHNCNFQTLPAPPVQSLNGLRCHVCTGGSCLLINECRGNEDRCFRGTDTDGNTVAGCVSANVCPPGRIDEELPFFDARGELQGPNTCCDSDLCNGFRCLSCTDSTCSSTVSVTCSPGTMCVTASIVSEDLVTSNTDTSFFRGCASSSQCPSTGPTTFSVDLGVSTTVISAECCDTGDCNSQAFPTTPTPIPIPATSTNGLQCHVCFAGQCSAFGDCQGDMNMCFRAKDAAGIEIAGCASTNVCDVAQTDGELFGEPASGTLCCSTSLCNNVPVL